MNVEDIRRILSSLYSEKMIWEKDSKKKRAIMEHRNDIENNDNALHGELIQIRNTIEKAITELEQRHESSWESISK